MPVASPPARPAAAPGESREQRATRQKREREAGRIEKDIETREARQKQVEAQLADPEVYHDGAKAKDLVAEYERLRVELESLWQRLGEL